MSAAFQDESRIRARAEYLRVGVCPHLRPVAELLLQQGRPITFFGQPWTKNCRHWIYFEGVIDVEELKRNLSLEECVAIHRHRGTHDGSEQGFICSLDNDGVMGDHP